MKSTFSLVLLLFVCLLPGPSVAQGIVFEQGSWADAVKKARKQKKLLFLHIDKPGCANCSHMASAAFNSPIVREKFAVNFICFRTDKTTKTGQELTDKLEIDCQPSSLFIDLDNNPLARYCGYSLADWEYMEKAEEALIRHRESPVRALKKAYEKGDRSSELMRQYIVQQRRMGLSTNELLTTYLQTLPADSLQSASLLRFLFEQGPVMGSWADSVFRKNRSRVDSLYKVVGRPKAKELNDLILTNSLKKAVREKNRLYAYGVALDHMGTYSDPKTHSLIHDWVMIRYFSAVSDTIRYLKIASRYFDNYYMRASVDSIQNLDVLDNQRYMLGTRSSSSGNTRPYGSGDIRTTNPNTHRFITALNTAAWDFYTITRDTTYLKKALAWSKRTLEFREDPNSLNTYAHLLYRLGQKADALNWQEKAVKLEQERNSPLAGTLQESLLKMKAGTL